MDKDKTVKKNTSNKSFKKFLAFINKNRIFVLICLVLVLLIINFIVSGTIFRSNENATEIASGEFFGKDIDEAYEKVNNKLDENLPIDTLDFSARLMPSDSEGRILVLVKLNNGNTSLSAFNEWARQFVYDVNQVEFIYYEV